MSPLIDKLLANLDQAQQRHERGSDQNLARRASSFFRSSRHRRQRAAATRQWKRFEQSNMYRQFELAQTCFEQAMAAYGRGRGEDYLLVHVALSNLAITFHGRGRLAPW